MNLTPREKDKLLISMAAIVARRRLERGVKLAAALDGMSGTASPSAHSISPNDSTIEYAGSISQCQCSTSRCYGLCPALV